MLASQQLLVANVNRFNPNNIAGLKVWLRADTLRGADGSVVATWPDLGGNPDTTQSTSANQPTLKTNIVNGRSVVRFAGTPNQWMNFPATGNDATVFVVGAIIVAAGSQTVYSPFVINNGAGGGFRLCAVLSTTNWGTYIGSDLSAAEVLGTNVFNILELTTVAGATFLYRNGVQKATSASHSQGGGAQELGAETAPSRYLKGDIAEMIIYNTVLSAVNRRLVELYLSSFYNIPV